MCNTLGNSIVAVETWVRVATFRHQAACRHWHGMSLAMQELSGAGSAAAEVCVLLIICDMSFNDEMQGSAADPVRACVVDVNARQTCLQGRRTARNLAAP